MNKGKEEFFADDQQLIHGLKQGSSETLDHLYRTYFPMVVKLIRDNSGTEEDAKDIFQDTVLVLYDRVRQPDFELTSKLKTYLYAVSRRLWLKQLNRNGRFNDDIADYEDALAIEEDLGIHEETDRQYYQMEEALMQLGEPCKSIITDFYIQNRSMQDICDKFGYTNADNAKNQKYKCLQRLKKLFFQISDDLAEG
ncbi:RNA polymerase sigma factor, sigma-70 family [bacterium A37T11]|nr:RNA polymerase sigma factor, sigma-70 family [bacterium A37T11]